MVSGIISIIPATLFIYVMHIVMIRFGKVMLLLLLLIIIIEENFKLLKGLIKHAYAYAWFINISIS